MADTKYFQYQRLLSPPIYRAAYSDRTAWLMAEMSRIAYIKFEADAAPLKDALAQAKFVLVKTFDREGTQAFLARRSSDGMAVLAFRGTEVSDPRDVMADIDAKFYQDDKGAKIHNGFYQAFHQVAEDVSAALSEVSSDALYVTGHSLGGAVALIATRSINTDNLAACYTFGSPRVGNEDFDEIIKAPIYRIVNAFDIVPFSPPALLFDVLEICPWSWAKQLTKTFHGYVHHGDVRYISLPKDDGKVRLSTTCNDFARLKGLWFYKKECVKYHAMELYCEHLAHWALKRNEK